MNDPYQSYVDYLLDQKWWITVYTIASISLSLVVTSYVQFFVAHLFVRGCVRVKAITSHKNYVPNYAHISLRRYANLKMRIGMWTITTFFCSITTLLFYNSIWWQIGIVALLLQVWQVTVWTISEKFVLHLLNNRDDIPTEEFQYLLERFCGLVRQRPFRR